MVSHGLAVFTHQLLDFSAGPLVDHAACSCKHETWREGVPSSEVELAPRRHSSSDLLGQVQLHAPLLRCAGLNAKQLLGELPLQLELFECLLRRAVMYGFAGASASVCTLLVALTKGFPWSQFVHFKLTPPGKDRVHPVLQLLQEPVLVVVNPEAVCTVLEACIKAGPCDGLLHDVLQLHVAAGLSADDVRQLARTCVMYRNADALRVVLEHPSAPGCADAEVQQLQGMLRRD